MSQKGYGEDVKEGMTMQQLGAEIRRRAQTKVDYIVRTPSLIFSVPEVEREIEAAVARPLTRDLGGNHIVLNEWWDEVTARRQAAVQQALAVRPPSEALLGFPVKEESGKIVVHRVRMNSVAHDQLGTHVGIPAKYYDRLLADFPGLLATNVNTLLQAAPNDEWRTVRVMDLQVGTDAEGNPIYVPTARAFVSDAYEMLDNWDLMRFLLPLFAPTPTYLRDGTVIEPLRDPWGDPLKVEFRSCDITDSRMYIKIVVPNVKADIGVGDWVRAGALIQNSEVGYGLIGVWPMIEILSCTNGAIMTKFATTKRHVGRRKGGEGNGEGNDAWRFVSDQTKRAHDKAFFLEMADVVRGTLTEAVFNQMLEPIRASRHEKIEGHAEAAVAAMGSKLDVGLAEQDEIARYFIDGGDLSKWGLSNAVTRYSQDVESYDRATELERVGGDIITLSDSDWHEIAVAKKASRKRAEATALVVAAR